VFPTGIEPRDEVAYTINNNGVISRGTVKVYDASPGVFAMRGDGRGAADARCVRTSDDGKDIELTNLPCAIGFEGESYSLTLYGTGLRFGAGATVRFRFVNQEGEFDEVEVAPSFIGEYVDANGKKYLGLDEIRVTLDAELAGIADAETMVLLVSNGESLTSQEGVTTAFLGVGEDMNIFNGASIEGGSVARGSIAAAFTQNDDDEEDVFSDLTLTAPLGNPPLELGGVRVRVAGRDARILSVAPDEVHFIVPAEVSASENVLFVVTGGQKVFNARTTVTDVAPGVFTESDDGSGPIAARCGLVLANGAIEYSAPPCAVSTANEKRILVIKGTGWRNASGVKLTFDNIELVPSFAGPEPGLPGVDRIEVVLTDELAGRENDLIVNAADNGETINSQSGATISFQSVPETDVEGVRKTRVMILPRLARPPLK
jgi:uncharacterized protein (TIGR03437 family)